MKITARSGIGRETLTDAYDGGWSSDNENFRLYKVEVHTDSPDAASGRFKGGLILHSKPLNKNFVEEFDFVRYRSDSNDLQTYRMATLEPPVVLPSRTEKSQQIGCKPPAAVDVSPDVLFSSEGESIYLFKVEVQSDSPFSGKGFKCKLIPNVSGASFGQDFVKEFDFVHYRSNCSDLQNCQIAMLGPPFVVSRSRAGKAQQQHGGLPAVDAVSDSKVISHDLYALSDKTCRLEKKVPARRRLASNVAHFLSTLFSSGLRCSSNNPAVDDTDIHRAKRGTSSEALHSCALGSNSATVANDHPEQLVGSIKSLPAPILIPSLSQDDIDASLASWGCESSLAFPLTLIEELSIPEGTRTVHVESELVKALTNVALYTAHHKRDEISVASNSVAGAPSRIASLASVLTTDQVNEPLMLSASKNRSKGDTSCFVVALDLVCELKSEAADESIVSRRLFLVLPPDQNQTKSFNNLDCVMKTIANDVIILTKARKSILPQEKESAALVCT